MSNANNAPRRRLIDNEPSDDDDNFEDETERILGDDSGEDENIEGEELIGDDMERDYRAIPELDVYENEGLDDDTDLEELSQTGRAEVEKHLNQRDRKEALDAGDLRRGIIPDLFAEDSDIDSNRHQRNAERIAMQDSDNMMESQIYEAVENLEDTRGMSTSKWVQEPATRQEIKNRFLSFIRTFVNNEGKSVYSERITAMAQRNGRSLTIDYGHLVAVEQELAFHLPEAPKEMLEVFDEVAFEVTLTRYPRYRQITSTIHVRISQLPLIDELRSLRQVHTDKLIRTSGVVSSCTNVQPQLSLVLFNCLKCRCLMGPYTRTDENSKELRPSSCPDCQSNGPFEVNAEKTLYKNYQRIKVQESPGSVPAGRIPRCKDAILLDDLVDTCKPGDEIDLTGTYCLLFDRSLNDKQGFPVFSTHILANNVLKKDEQVILSGLTDEDVRAIQQLGKDERIAERIIASISPSIYSHEDIKRAIALSLFGGVAKTGRPRIRGDINVLLVGDPGTAKSQFLKTVEQLAPRAVLTTGQGASAVGLTACVMRSPVTREWTLEAGALVLADRGVCLIDEFDKMNERDRAAIHEAMEQQTVSVSKAGIVGTLQARTAVLAAANPVGGRYDSGRNFSDNVDLSSPILSRFDVLCVVRDVADPVQDEQLARFVVGSHMRHHGGLTDEQMEENNKALEAKGAALADSGVELIPIEVLKKYIIYARQKISPRWDSSNEGKMERTYVDIRRASQESGGVDVTLRCLESMIRLAEAHAKMHLREVVTDDDVNMAIRVSLEAYISTEKYTVMKQLETRFSRFLNYKKNDDELLLSLLRQLVHEKKTIRRDADDQAVEVKEADLKERAKRLHITSVATFLRSNVLAKNRYYYDAGRKIIGHSY